MPLLFDLQLIAIVDQFGPLTDSAVGMKASADMQHRGLFWQGVGLGGVRLGGAVCLGRPLAQLRPHSASLHRGQLIFVAQQNQPSLYRHTFHQSRHEF